MTETTVPAVDQNLNRVAWQAILGPGDGIVNDFTGDAYPLTLAGDTATVGVAGASYQFRRDGFVHTLTGTVAFTLNPVTATTNYTIGVLGTPASEAASLLTLVADVVGGPAVTPDVNGGTYNELHRVTRVPSTTMSGTTTRRDGRVWAGETVYARSVDVLPASPCGSLAYLESGARFLRVRSGSGLVWSSIAAAPQAGTFAFGPGYTAYGSPAATPSWVLDSTGLVTLQGLIQRTPASAFTTTPNVTYTLTTTSLPVEARPGGSRNVYLLAGSDTGPVDVIVTPTGGLLFRTKTAVTLPVGWWVSLDGLTYRQV